LHCRSSCSEPFDCCGCDCDCYSTFPFDPSLALNGASIPVRTTTTVSYDLRKWCIHPCPNYYELSRPHFVTRECIFCIALTLASTASIFTMVCSLSRNGSIGPFSALFWHSMLCPFWEDRNVKQYRQFITKETGFITKVIPAVIQLRVVKK